MSWFPLSPPARNVTSFNQLQDHFCLHSLPAAYNLQSVSPRDDGPAQLTVRTEDGTVVTIAASECCLQNERDDTVDDLVRSDFLHEPG